MDNYYIPGWDCWKDRTTNVKDITKPIVVNEMIGLHRKIGTRLFGERGKDCLNLTSGEGIIGELVQEISELRRKIAKLESQNPLYSY